MTGRASGRRQLAHAVAAAAVIAVSLSAAAGADGRRLAPADRAAFLHWFVLLADAQFERPAAEVTDCAALVRYAFREALRPHTAEWVRRAGLGFVPHLGDVRSGPSPGPGGWPLFRTAGGDAPRYGEFADARTLVGLNSRFVSRDAGRAQPGDLLYFRRAGAVQPDHVMVFVGPSRFDAGPDWVVYHTGPDGASPGEVRKVRLDVLRRHPAPTWRPLAGNDAFVGVFRLDLL